MRRRLVCFLFHFPGFIMISRQGATRPMFWCAKCRKVRPLL